MSIYVECSLLNHSKNFKIIQLVKTYDISWKKEKKKKGAE